MQGDDESVRTAAGGCLVVVPRDQGGDRVGEVGGERRPVGRGGEPDLAVDGERGQPLAGGRRAGEQLPHLPDQAGGQGEHPAG